MKCLHRTKQINAKTADCSQVSFCRAITKYIVIPKDPCLPVKVKGLGNYPLHSKLQGKEVSNCWVVPSLFATSYWLFSFWVSRLYKYVNFSDSERSAWLIVHLYIFLSRLYKCQNWNVQIWITFQYKSKSQLTLNLKKRKFVIAHTMFLSEALTSQRISVIFD